MRREDKKFGTIMLVLGIVFGIALILVSFLFLPYTTHQNTSSLGSLVNLLGTGAFAYFFLGGIAMIAFGIIGYLIFRD